MYMRRKIVRERTVFAVYDALLFDSLNIEFDPKGVLCGTFQCKYKDIDKEYIEVFTKALLNEKTIIEAVDEYLVNWSFFRLSWITKAIFLVSYSETVLVKAVPLEISINEAIEIARKYVSDSETKYLNAVLNKVLRKALGIKFEEEKVEVDEKDFEVIPDDKIEEIRKLSEQGNND